MEESAVTDDMVQKAARAAMVVEKRIVKRMYRNQNHTRWENKDSRRKISMCKREQYTPTIEWQTKREKQGTNNWGINTMIKEKE